MSVPIYEYYDDYEHIWSMYPEEERHKVKYIVLGDQDEKSVVICYVLTEYNHMATIGKRVHNAAWIVSEMALEDARNIVRKVTSDKNITKLEEEIQKSVENKFVLDRRNAPGIGNSSSTTVHGVSVRWTSEDSFTDKYVEALRYKIRTHRVALNFL